MNWGYELGFTRRRTSLTKQANKGRKVPGLPVTFSVDLRATGSYDRTGIEQRPVLTAMGYGLWAVG